MKFLIAMTLLIATSVAQAETSLGAPARDVEATGNCRMDYPFVPTSGGQIRHVIFWSGKCLNGKADGFGYVADDVTGKGYFAEFRNGNLYNNVFAELKETGTPKVKGYTLGFPVSKVDDNYCGKFSDRCQRLLSNLASAESIGVISQSTSGCQVNIKTSTTPYFEQVAWNGKCANGKAQGPGWVTYQTLVDRDSVELYTEFANARQSTKYYYKRITKANGSRSEYLGKMGETLNAESVNSCGGDSACQRVLSAGKKGPGQTSNNSGQGDSNSGDSISDGYGRLTSKPGGYVTEEGPRVTCDQNLLAAQINSYVRKIEPESRGNLCAANKAQVKLFYFVITLIEKSCPPSDADTAKTRADAVAGMETYKAAVNNSCTL